jgi:hypothetical protein
MKKNYLNLFICVLVVVVIGFSGMNNAGAADDEDNGKIKLTTCDLHKPYVIKGLIQVRIGQPDINKVNEMLLEEAKKLDADCVVGVGYMEAYGYLFGYGTAVKVK